ncbi:transglycosylase SLT domain-containing protein [Candidatus Magnetomonas plexicatena]|uniref:transglycosylase SLT domain-containing protein n=1 Tax=Candidatus Magnetomonas plexicatena TaxID=2552947 RepID=UPI00110160CC|nr:lytic transglycosylase domain-containing protein [Nitrospirales bacterium LBB_01]
MLTRGFFISFIILMLISTSEASAKSKHHQHKQAVKAKPAPVKTNTAPKTLSDEELIDKLLYGAPSVYSPAGKSNVKRVLRWKTVLSEKDIQYDTDILTYKGNNAMGLRTSYQNLIAGWQRLVKSGHLRMIYNKCRANAVPFEIVLLALAESSWNATALSSSGAGGYWQFMPDTAKSYGLIDTLRGHDHRNDPELSTDAAIALLKDNFNMTYSWDRAFGVKGKKPTNSERWLWAFWTYNSSPKSVSHYYRQSKGNSSVFYKYVENVENANYVHKIFGIKEVLRDYVKQTRKYPYKKYENTPYGEYIQKWYTLTVCERKDLLSEVNKQFQRPAAKKPDVLAVRIKRETDYVSALCKAVE